MFICWNAKRGACLMILAVMTTEKYITSDCCCFVFVFHMHPSFECMCPLWRIMWWTQPFLPALVLLSELSVVRVQTAPCQTCRKLTESFIKVVHLPLVDVHKLIHKYCICVYGALKFPFLFRAWRKQPTRTLGEVIPPGRRRSWPSMHAGKTHLYVIQSWN